MEAEEFKMDIPSKVRYIGDVLIANGYEAYVVGGAVRDAYMYLEPHDYDIATNARPEEVMKLFKCFASGIEFGTVTAVIGDKEDKEGFEITTFRKEGAYSDGRHPDRVEYADNIYEDLSRRDFTINALAYDLKNNCLIDKFGGLEDIENGLIRGVGDVKERYKQDALRMLRAIRFCAKLGFEMEAFTETAILDLHQNIELVSPERWRDELTKILNTANPMYGFEKMHEDGLLKHIIPELDRCFDCEQNNPYHYENVAMHSLRVVSTLAQADMKVDGQPLQPWVNNLTILDNVNDDVLWAGLLHDIGKPDSKITKQDGSDGFYDHPTKSAEIASAVLQRLRFSNAQKDNIVDLVKCHEVAYHRDSQIRRFVADKGMVFCDELYALQLADNYSHSKEHIAVLEAETERFHNRCKDVYFDKTAISKWQMEVNGKDMMALGLKGKEIGECLEKLYCECLGNPQVNKHDKLMHIAERFARKVINNRDKEADTREESEKCAEDEGMEH